MASSSPRQRRHRDDLKDHCARWTVPRGEILDLLARTEQHLSAKDVHRLLLPDNPDIGLTTVYRTLELLEKAGLARRMHAGDGQARFEYRHADGTDHHHHLICTACGTILNYRDFETEELELVRRTEELLARKHGFLIKDHNIEFLGLCATCRPGGTTPNLPQRTGGPSEHD
jgi:Fur family transcriptional regulator, ferric uptake regulator